MWATAHYGRFGSFTSIHSLEPSINCRHIKMPRTTLWKGTNSLVKKAGGKTKNQQQDKCHFQISFYTTSFFTLTCIYPCFHLSRVSTVLLILYERAYCHLSAGGAVKAFRVKAWTVIGSSIRRSVQPGSPLSQSDALAVPLFQMLDVGILSY